MTAAVITIHFHPPKKPSRSVYFDQRLSTLDLTNSITFEKFAIFFIINHSIFRTNENPVHYKVQIASGDRVPKIEKEETVEIRLNGKNQLRVFHWSVSSHFVIG